MLEELAVLGFDAVELGHGIRLPLLDGVLKAVERGVARISSVHNFCPLPLEVMVDSPDCYEFTSHRESDRRRALRLTRETIELAARVGAPHVVLHGGRVRTMRTYRKLLGMVRERKFLTKEYGAAKIAAVKERESAGPAYVARLQKALEEIVSHAAKHNVRLGLENRERYEDVPSEREFETVIDHFASPHLGYWHDFGHAQIKQNLSLLDHRDWLERIGRRTIGCHVHDVAWLNNDHQPPFEGDVDFHSLIPLLPQGCLFVFEISPHCERDEILRALERWKTEFES